MTRPPSPAALIDLRNTYRREQATIAAGVMQDVAKLWSHVDPADVDKAWPVVSAALRQVVTKGHAQSVAAGAAYVTAKARLHGIETKAVHAAALPAEQLETSLRVTGPVAFKRAVANGMRPDMAHRAAMVELSGSTSRLTRAGGRSTIVRTASESQHVTGWARVTDGNCCDWCEMLAGRGAVYHTEVTAGAGDEWHDHCNCEADAEFETVGAPIADEPPSVGELAVQALTATPDAAAGREAATVAPAVEAPAVETHPLAGLSDDELAGRLGTVTDPAQIDEIVAELDRRDEVAKEAEKVTAAKARRKAARDVKRGEKVAAQDAEFDRLLAAGYDPEEAYAEAHGITVERMRRDEAISALRGNGYTGPNFDTLSRAAFRDYVNESMIAAEESDTVRGVLFRQDAGTLEWKAANTKRLFNGSEAFARANASDELLEYWQTHGRLSLADFQAGMLNGQIRKDRAAWL